MYDKILVEWTTQRCPTAPCWRPLFLFSTSDAWVLHLREREIAVKTGMAMMDETSQDANAAVSAVVEKLTKRPA